MNFVSTQRRIKRIFFINGIINALRKILLPLAQGIKRLIKLLAL